MSDHIWVQEHVAAYVAGGLDAQEAERLEAHARDCAACGAVLAAARRSDSGLSSLFADARPDWGLEDRTIARMRTATIARRAVLPPRAKKWAGAMAAVLLLAAVGVIAGSFTSSTDFRSSRAQGDLMEQERAMVDNSKSMRQREAEAHASRERAAAEKLANVDPGFDSNIEAALPQIDRLDKQTVDGRRGQVTPPWSGVGVIDGLDKQTVDGAVTNDTIGQPNAAETQTAAAKLREAAQRGRQNRDGSYTGDTQTKLNSAETDFTVLGDPGPSSVNTNGHLKELKLKPPAAQPFDPKPQPKPDSKTHINFSTGTWDVPKIPEPSSEPARRIILRSGDVEFEVESFDAAIATATKLTIGTKGAFVATVNSDKLPNGKVKGSITVRVPPEHLDGLVLDLRRELGKGGELKGVKLASQDVTKMYTDMESRLKAARTMETRLLQIIKEGKGEIKQLLEAEKELGVWRTKIEEYEGEIRYYANLAALSTLTISLTEKEIRAAAAITEREHVRAGVEVEDVDKAYQQLLAAVQELKGRVTKSELKQLAAGQFNATLKFEVAAESSGPARDRLRMLGRVARLEIDRSVQTENGTLPSDAKVKRGDTAFDVQLYNLANVPPRETVTLQLAAPDVPTAYQALRDAIGKTTGRVLVAQLNEQDRQNVSAEFEFEVRRAEEGAARAALDAAGEVRARQIGRAAEAENVTDSKIKYRVTLLAADRLKPREVVTLTVQVPDVDGSATLFAAQVSEVKGRQADAKLDRDANGRVTAKLSFEVPLAAAPGLVERFKSAGTVQVSQSARDPQAPEGRYATARIHVTLTNAEAIVPEGDGLLAKVRQGLSISASWLLKSVTVIVIGLCVVLPWAIIGFAGYRLVRRVAKPTPAAPPAPPPPVS